MPKKLFTAKQNERLRIGSGSVQVSSLRPLEVKVNNLRVRKREKRRIDLTLGKRDFTLHMRTKNNHVEFSFGDSGLAASTKVFVEANTKQRRKDWDKKK